MAKSAYDDMSDHEKSFYSACCRAMTFLARVEMVTVSLKLKHIGFVRTCCKCERYTGNLHCKPRDIPDGFTQALWDRMKRAETLFQRTHCAEQSDGSLQAFKSSGPTEKPIKELLPQDYKSAAAGDEMDEVPF